MQKIINNIGEENIYILIGIIIAIIIALLIIIIIEKISDRKYSSEINYYKKEKKSRKKAETEIEVFDENPVVINEEKSEIPTEPIIEKQTIVATNKEKTIEKEPELIYVTEEQTKEEAKKAIEEAAKKLVYEEQSDIVSPTFFEKVQEEQSIISYEELLNTSMHAVIEKEREIVEEGNEPITIDEIYEQEQIEQEEKISIIDESNLVEESMDELYELEENYQNNNINKDNKDKFIPSDVISPVFGVKREVVYEKEYNELGETINVKELEVEIKRTEEFLKELKKLKNKLD